LVAPFSAAYLIINAALFSFAYRMPLFQFEFPAADADSVFAIIGAIDLFSAM